MKKILPVSLSFSGAVSAHLKRFALVVDSVPMTSSQAANPQGEAYRKLLISTQLFNPFFGQAVTRNSLDLSYREFWRPVVAEQLKEHSIDPSRATNVLEGYLALSRSVEGYEWSTVANSSELRRHFLVGMDESKPLLRSQLEAFLQILNERDDVILFVIESAGHHMHIEQPATTARVLQMIAEDEIPVKAGVLLLDPSSGKIETFAGRDAGLAKIEGLLRALPR